MDEVGVAANLHVASLLRRVHRSAKGGSGVGEGVVVVDAGDLARDAPGTLAALCSALEVSLRHGRRRPKVGTRDAARNGTAERSVFYSGVRR